MRTFIKNIKIIPESLNQSTAYPQLEASFKKQLNTRKTKAMQVRIYKIKVY